MSDVGTLMSLGPEEIQRRAFEPGLGPSALCRGTHASATRFSIMVIPRNKNVHVPSGSPPAMSGPDALRMVPSPAPSVHLFT